MQGQANAWIRALESRNGLRVTKPGDANFLRTIESCVRVGNPVLIGELPILSSSSTPLHTDALSAHSSIHRRLR
jgi:hypothetical protein